MKSDRLYNLPLVLVIYYCKHHFSYIESEFKIHSVHLFSIISINIVKNRSIYLTMVFLNCDVSVEKRWKKTNEKNLNYF